MKMEGEEKEKEEKGRREEGKGRRGEEEKSFTSANGDYCSAE